MMGPKGIAKKLEGATDKGGGGGPSKGKIEIKNNPIGGVVAARERVKTLIADLDLQDKKAIRAKITQLEDQRVRVLKDKAALQEVSHGTGSSETAFMHPQSYSRFQSMGVQIHDIDSAIAHLKSLK